MKRLGLLLSITAMISCSHFEGARSPQSETLLKNLEKLSDLTKSRIASPGVNCAQELKAAIPSLASENLYSIQEQDLNAVAPKIMQQTWQIRVNLNQNMANLASCRDQVRQVNYLTREIEDLLGDKFYKQPALKTDGNDVDGKPFDFTKQATPIYNAEAYKGYLYKPGYKPGADFEFKSGDLMITRGPSFFSATLASVTNNPGQFSHFVLVNVDKDKKVSTIESYAQTGGIAEFSIKEALENENIRIMVLRPRDEKAGIRAADYIKDMLAKEARGEKPKTGYDYFMNLNDPSKMTCSEVAYYGYLKGSGDQFKIPEDKSIISTKLNPILKPTGILSGPTLAPQDMEVDSRFELLMEFRDYRFVRDTRYRDVIMASVLDWIQNKNYQLQGTFSTTALSIIYPTRNTPIWGLIKKIPGVKDFPKGTPKGFLKALSQIGGIGEFLYARVKEKDDAYIKQTGWPMTRQMLAQAIEDIRTSDLAIYKDNDPSKTDTLHQLIRDPRTKLAPRPNYGGN